MAYFPLCQDLRGKRILLAGKGPQTDDKLTKLSSFGARIQRMDTVTAEDLSEDVVLVVAGDLPLEDSARISQLCTERRVPVNVVDEPELCSFFFPALITRGDLTISISTGGRSPGAAAYLGRRIDALLPDRTEEILVWLHDARKRFYETYPKAEARTLLHQATQRAFELGRPLTDDEILDFSREIW